MSDASEIEAETIEVISSHPSSSFVVDTTDLTMISADGLRMLVRLRQEVGESITVVNVALEVLQTFPVTDFTQMTSVYPR